MEAFFLLFFLKASSSRFLLPFQALSVNVTKLKQGFKVGIWKKVELGEWRQKELRYQSSGCTSA